MNIYIYIYHIYTMSFENYGLNKSLIWITIINHGYIEYTKNFLISMDLLKINFKLIVYCIDDASYEELKSHNNCICIKADFLKYNLPSDLKVWMNIDYKRITFAKLDAILYTLKNTYDLGIENVGYIDTDIVLFSDPTQKILDIMNENKNINIFAQCDEGYFKQCTNPLNCRNMCSGVIVFRNNKELYNIFNYEDKDVFAHLGDQSYLQSVLNNRKIPFLTMPRNMFPNGSYYCDLKNKEIEFEESNILIHFNYMVGHEKKQSMKLQRLWFIE